MNKQERVKNKVDKGVVLLDQNYEGWWRGIDVDNLRMSSCSRCVLGQLFGRYSNGLHHPLVGNIDSTDGIHYGFDTNFNESGIDYHDLTGEWQRRITQIQKERN